MVESSEHEGAASLRPYGVRHTVVANWNWPKKSVPRTTHCYPFEAKVLGFATELADRFASPGGSRTFLLTLSRSGGFSSLGFDPPGAGWFEHMKTLDRQEASFLFFDPFDAPDYSYLCWSRIERAAMERMMAEQFEGGDFVSWIPPHLERKALAVPGEFPETWSVMF